MHHTSTRHTAMILLTCFSLVFLHAFTPHSHLEDELVSIDHHQDNSGKSHSHSGLSEILDFLKEAVHSQIGENHLEEYLTSPKESILRSTNVFSTCDLPFGTIQFVFYPKVFDSQKEVNIPLQHKFIESSPRRGPPSQS